jgi:CheY-like chemotaxis protein
MKTILIVEDDAIIARIYQGLLRSEGFDVHVASDGQSATEFLQDSRPDLVLLDLMLPKKNGLQVLKQIRGTPGLGSLPVIVFSNAYMGSLMRDALREGATHCFAKAQTPPRKVVQAIRGYLDLNQPDTGAAAPTAARSQTPRPGQGPNKPAQAVSKMRAALQALAKAETPSDRLTQLSALSGILLDCCPSGHAESDGAAQAAGALRALINQMREQPTKTDFSLLRTLAQGVDCLDALYARVAQGQTVAPKASAVLVLDADPASRGLICPALERVGFRPFEVHDPKTAWQILVANSFDLVLLNADSPGVNGGELCRLLRDSEKNKKTPVVLIAGPTNLEGRAFSIMSGADDVLRKPVSPAELGLKALLYVLNPRPKAKTPAPSTKPGTVAATA